MSTKSNNIKDLQEIMLAIEDLEKEISKLNAKFDKLLKELKKQNNDDKKSR